VGFHRDRRRQRDGDPEVERAGGRDDRPRRVQERLSGDDLVRHRRDAVAPRGRPHQGHVGFESPLPKDNWNYTQAWTGNLTPSYHLGVKATIPSAIRSPAIHVCNGWQIAGDNNDGKSLGTNWCGCRLRFADLQHLVRSWSANDDDTMRRLFDLVATVQAADGLQLAFEGISGWQERVAGRRL
jgi:hypothetical protein